MKKIKNIIYIAGLMAMILSGCKDCDDPANPDCKNYDPCLGEEAANADFGIYEVFKSSNNEQFENETDTIKSGFTSVLFRPKHKNDKVTWYVGSEVFEQEQVVKGLFPDNRNLTVTMIAEKNATNCLKGSVLHDTITKQFYAKNIGDVVMSKEDAQIYPFWGTWEGYNTDTPHEKFRITIGHIQYNNNKYFVNFVVAGLPKGLPLLPKPINQPEYVQIPHISARVKGYHLMYSNYGHFNSEAVLKIKDHILTIDYRYNETPYLQYLLGESQQETYPLKFVRKTFIGKKISNEIETQ